AGGAGADKAGPAPPGPTPPEALRLMEKALKHYEAAFGPDGVENPVAVLGFAYQRAGDYGRAEPLLARAVRLAEKKYGPDHPQAADRLEDLAGLCEEMGQWSRALTLRE